MRHNPKLYQPSGRLLVQICRGINNPFLYPKTWFERLKERIRDWLTE